MRYVSRAWVIVGFVARSGSAGHGWNRDKVANEEKRCTIESRFWGILSLCYARMVIEDAVVSKWIGESYSQSRFDSNAEKDWEGKKSVLDSQQRNDYWVGLMIRNGVRHVR